MGALVPVREFRTAAEQRAHYAALMKKYAHLMREVPAHRSKPWDHPRITMRRAPLLLPPVRTAAQIQGRAQDSMAECIRIAALIADVPIALLHGPRNVARVSRARQIAYWLAAKRAGASYHQIAARLGRRHHTSVMHGVRRVQAVIDARLVFPTDDLCRTAYAMWAADWPPLH